MSPWLILLCWGVLVCPASAPLAFSTLPLGFPLRAYGPVVARVSAVTALSPSGRRCALTEHPLDAGTVPASPVADPLPSACPSSCPAQSKPTVRQNHQVASAASRWCWGWARQRAADLSAHLSPWVETLDTHLRKGKKEEEKK